MLGRKVLTKVAGQTHQTAEKALVSQAGKRSFTTHLTNYEVN